MQPWLSAAVVLLYTLVRLEAMGYGRDVPERGLWRTLSHQELLLDHNG